MLIIILSKEYKASQGSKRTEHAFRNLVVIFACRYLFTNHIKFVHNSELGHRFTYNIDFIDIAILY